MADLQGLDPKQIGTDNTGVAGRLNTWRKALVDAIAVAADTVLTTRGDLLTRSASALVRLGIGAANTVLKSDGTDPSWAQIVNADIADDTIAVGKLADGTAGQLITWDAAGEATTVATGAAAQVLTSNGAGAAPTFQAATIGSINALTTDDVLDSDSDFVPYYDTGEGANNKATLRRLSALAFLESQAASNSATIDFALDSYLEYKHFLVIIDYVVPQTDTASLRLTVSTDGGTSFDGGASDYAYNGLGETSALITNVDNAAAFIQINSASATLGTGANEQFSAEIHIYDPAATGKNTRFQWNVVQYNSTPHITTMQGVGQRLADQDTTDIRFAMSTGNIASGTFALYGVRA